MQNLEKEKNEVYLKILKSKSRDLKVNICFLIVLKNKNIIYTDLLPSFLMFLTAKLQLPVIYFDDERVNF